MAERLQFPASWHHPAMPGYGTFPAPFATAGVTIMDAARASQPHIEQALSLGYRHLDTAFSYRNQDLVGAAVRAAGVPRQEVFITSKLHPNDNTHRRALFRIQEALRLMWNTAPTETDGYLDAFLLHYPGWKDPLGAWQGLLDARARGWLRHAGVSNFEIRHLDKLRRVSGQYPEINQIEFHPYLYLAQKELLEFCQANSIAVEGYSPLTEGAVLSQPELQALAQKHRTSPARVALKWSIQHGVRPIVGSRNPGHLKENAEDYAFTLSPDEMARLDALSATRPVRVSLQWGWNPATAPLGTSRLRTLAVRLVERVAQATRRR